VNDLELDLDALLGSRVAVQYGGHVYQARRFEDAPISLAMEFEQLRGRGEAIGAETRYLEQMALITELPVQILTSMSPAQIEALTRFLSSPRPAAEGQTAELQRSGGNGSRTSLTLTGGPTETS